MIKRIGALAFIFVCTSIAWIILGSTIFSRTESPLSGELKSRVAGNWGTEQQQSPPKATYQHESTRTEEDRKETKQIKASETISLPLEATKADVTLGLDYRQKGLLWYSTYTVAFRGDYSFTNSSGQDQDVTFQLCFPSQQAIYDDLVMSVDNQALTVKNTNAGVLGTARVAAGKTAVLHAGYRSQGLDSWRYDFGKGVSQIRNFTLNVHTNFKGIDFPENTISPTTKRETDKGWDLTWNYTNLVSGYAIGITMPQKLQPGPLAGQISFFAPVSLFFFFFLMFIITTLRGINLHPMNYFFLAGGIFCLPHFIGVFGGPRFHTHCLRNLFAGFDLSCGQLSAAGGGNAVRGDGGWLCAVDLPDTVFVRIFFQGFHRTCGYDWLYRDVVCNHANDRTN